MLKYLKLEFADFLSELLVLVEEKRNFLDHLICLVVGGCYPIKLGSIEFITDLSEFHEFRFFLQGVL